MVSVPLMSPLPLAGIPVTLPVLSRVQLKVVPETLPLRTIVVMASPEHILWVEGVAIASGNGFTVTSTLPCPVHPEE